MEVIADLSLIDFGYVTAVTALAAVAAHRRPVTVGTRVRIVAADPERQNGFVGEIGTVTSVDHFHKLGVTCVGVDLGDDQSVPFDGAEVVRVSRWAK